MILLFGDNNKTRTSATQKNTNVKSNPVENAGILAMNFSEAKSTLTMGEFDTYVSSSPTVVDYSNYANVESFESSTGGFMGEFSAAVASLGDFGGFSGGSFAGCSTGSTGSSCGSFASFC